MTLSDCISPIVRSINEPTCEQLVEVLKRLRAEGYYSNEEVPQPDSLPYGRKVLYADETTEIILVHIPPQSATRIHDHGLSVGAALVLEGQLVNVIYRLDVGNTVSPEIELHARCGDYYVAESCQIHQMCNPYEERVVSLHLYSPPLTGARVYAE